MSIIEPAERKTHTDGEWTVIRTNVDDIPGWYVGVDRPSAHTEAFGFWTPIARINNKPDAQLISQASRMLASLEAIRTAYDNAASHGHAIPSELVRAIGESAAITAKAKGWATA